MKPKSVHRRVLARGAHPFFFFVFFFLLLLFRLGIDFQVHLVRENEEMYDSYATVGYHLLHYMCYVLTPWSDQSF